MNRYRFAAGVSAAAVAVAACTASAQSADDLAAKFGAREMVRSVSLSPDGKQVVLVGPRPDGGENALVITIATGASVPILSSKGRTEQIANCRFVLTTRVVCQVYMRAGSNDDVEGATRLVSLAADGSDMKLLTARATTNAYYQSNYGGDIIDYNVTDNPNAVLMTRVFAPERSTGTITASSASGLGIEEVDLISMSRKRVETPRQTAFDYITDGHGNVRLMGLQPSTDTGYARRIVNFQYRPLEGRWTDLTTVNIDGGLYEGFMPVAVDAAENVAYGFNSHGGYQALFKMALDGTAATSLVLGRDDADVDALIRIGRNQRIVGASYATERRVVDYFDPELKRLAGSLGNALGGKQISIVDSTADEGKLLLYAGSDTDPGKYYLFDKSTRQLGQLFPARPELAGVPLGTMKAIEYPAADGTMVPAYLTLPPGSDGKNLPAIVMPHGGPSSRDEWGFDWLAQYFVARGYAVLQPNYRGSSGMGSQWFQKNGFQSWETAISDVNAAGRWLEAEGIAGAGKLAIVGWSYGGYAALQSAVLDPNLYKAIVAIAPVTDLDRVREEARNYSNFLLVDNFIGKGPHVAAASPARHAEVFQAPVLLFHGDTDTNVNVAESRLMQSRLKDAGKQVSYVEFAGLDHQLEDPQARSRLLSESDRFLRQALGI